MALSLALYLDSLASKIESETFMSTEVQEHDQIIFKSNYSKASPSPLRAFCDQLDKDFTNQESNRWAYSQTQGYCLFCGDDLVIGGEQARAEFAAGFRKKLELVVGAKDHLWPSSMFGLRTKGNMALVCGPCNTEKNGTEPLIYWKIRSFAGLPLFISDEEEFKLALDKHWKPYRKSFPREFELAMNFNKSKNEIRKILAEWVLDVPLEREGLDPYSPLGSELFHAVSTLTALAKAKAENSSAEKGTRDKAACHKARFAQKVFMEVMPTKMMLSDLNKKELITYGLAALTKVNQDSTSFGDVKKLLRNVFDCYPNREIADEAMAALPGFKAMGLI